jgi:hypothetical protein
MADTYSIVEVARWRRRHRCHFDLRSASSLFSTLYYDFLSPVSGLTEFAPKADYWPLAIGRWVNPASALLQLDAAS